MFNSKARVALLIGAAVLAIVGAARWMQSAMGADLLPHAFCITASPGLLWLHVMGDSLVALAYLMIPVGLVQFVRKRPDIPFGWLALLFGAFIVSCGITHVLDVWTLWQPVYWYSGTAKAVTAGVSLATALVLMLNMPRLLAIPSAEQLRTVNRALEQEVATRRQVESELRQTQAQLEALLARTTAQAQETAVVLDRFFDEAPLGLVVLDEGLNYVRVNNAIAAVNGVAPERHRGMNLREIARNLPTDTVQVAVREAEQVIATRQPSENVEVTGTDARGAERHWMVQSFPIPLPDGRLLVGGMVQDISYQRGVERERTEALAAAEEANRQKDEFFAKVSHELRSPLQVALSATEVLARLPDLPPAATRVAQRLSHSVRQQARMVSDLLDLSRIQSGKLHMEPALIDPAQPLLDALDHWQQVAAARDVRIDARALEAGQVRIEVDPARLEQIHTNLLDNAIRFSPEGGTVEVGGRVEPPPNGSAGADAAHAAGGRWHLWVRDEGVGLEPDEIAAIFQPFAQGHRQPPNGKGLGLGLSIVHSLVQAFGGRIWVDSAGRGQGATFHVELPVAGKPKAAAAQYQSVPSRLDGVRLLYVEDDPAVAQAMRDGLAALGAQVSLAADDRQAIEQLGAAAQPGGQPFDVLVSDLNLGDGRSGLELLRALRRGAPLRGLPAVAVSAFGGPEHRRGTREAGFAEHLVKPVDALAVAQAVARLLAR